MVLARIRRGAVVNTALVAIIIVAAVVAYFALRSETSSAAAEREVSVSRGTVTSSVSATGTVAPAESLSLTLPSSGLVTAVNPAVGTEVHAGDVLLTIDDFAANTKVQTSRTSVTQAEANLAKANASLQDLEDGPTSATKVSDQTSLAQADLQVKAAQTNLDQTKATADLNASQYQSSIDAAQSDYDSALSAANGDTTAEAVSQADDKLTLAKDAQTSGLLKDQQAVANAQQSIDSANVSYFSAVAKVQLNQEPPTVTKLAQARADVRSAQANVESAKANLASAQNDLDKTKLVAPVDGTVTAVNATVGEYSGSGGSSSADTGSTSSSSSSSSSSSGSGSSSGSTGLVTLSTAGQPYVSASFSEVDAAKVKVGQTATVTFDSLSNATAQGEVTEVAEESTTSNNVVSYAVKVALSSTPDGVKTGMSANVQVTIQTKSNVLAVPTAAVTSAGPISTVKKVVRGKTETVRVETGLKGDTSTEITSGLKAGDVVAISIGASGTSTGAGGGAGAGGGGLSGGGPPGGGAFTGGGPGG